MPVRSDSRYDTSLLDQALEQDLGLSYSKAVIGAAIFDLSGLPKEYYTSIGNPDVSWVQTIFQALGLQSLLLSSLKVEGFRYVIVHGKEYRAIVVRQKLRYTALLLRRTTDPVSEAFVRWAQELEPQTLAADPRFSLL